MYKDMDIEEQKNILTGGFIKAMERHTCEAVAFGVKDIIENDIVSCAQGCSSYDNLYYLVNFLKHYVCSMDLVMRGYLEAEWRIFLYDWELHAKQEQQLELDEAREQQWEANDG